MVIIDPFELEQAHMYILHNYVEVVLYVNQHLVEHWIQNENTHSFIIWFREQILQELSNPNNTVSETLRWLSERPKVYIFRYSSYMLNGYQFYTKINDMWSTVQNSGVTLVAQALHVSSAKDKNHVYVYMSYYRIVEGI
ncbi:hypothetical protein UlMin_010816 [Ulmus minor]